jgi:hypothetical protein
MWVWCIGRKPPGGPSFATYDLIYAHVGSRVISAAELAFNLSLDRSVYIPVGPGPQSTPLQIRALITVRNTSVPLQITAAMGTTAGMGRVRGPESRPWISRGFGVKRRTPK